MRNLFDGPSHLQRIPNEIQSPLTWHRQLAAQKFFGNRPNWLRSVSQFLFRCTTTCKPLVIRIESESKSLDFHRANCFLQRLFECAANRHRLAHALHLRCQRFVSFREFFECPPRHLHHDIIDRWLEACARRPCDVVAQFVERISHRQFCGNTRDGKSCCL